MGQSLSLDGEANVSHEISDKGHNVTFQAHHDEPRVPHAELKMFTAFVGAACLAGSSAHIGSSCCPATETCVHEPTRAQTKPGGDYHPIIVAMHRKFQLKLD